MQNKEIIIRNTSSKYTIDVSDSLLKEYHETIIKCLNDEEKMLFHTDEEGNIEIYPAEMLKNSYITIANKPEQPKKRGVTYRTR